MAAYNVVIDGNVMTFPQMNSVAYLMFGFCLSVQFVIFNPNIGRVRDMNSEKSVFEVIVQDPYIF